jgi:hypothetical protein
VNGYIKIKDVLVYVALNKEILLGEATEKYDENTASINDRSMNQ